MTAIRDTTIFTPSGTRVSTRRDPGGSTRVRVNIPELTTEIGIPDVMLESARSSTAQEIEANISAAISSAAAQARDNLNRNIQNSIANALTFGVPVTTTDESRTATQAMAQRNQSTTVNTNFFPEEYLRNIRFEPYPFEDEYRSSQSTPSPPRRVSSTPPLSPLDDRMINRIASISEVKTQIRKYIAEELELKVETEKVNSRLEIKVSLVDVSSGKEVLSDSDYIEVDNE